MTHLVHHSFHSHGVDKNREKITDHCHRQPELLEKQVDCEGNKSCINEEKTSRIQESTQIAPLC